MSTTDSGFIARPTPVHHKTGFQTTHVITIDQNPPIPDLIYDVGIFADGVQIGVQGSSHAGEGGVFVSSLNSGVIGTNHENDFPGVLGVNKTGNGFGGIFRSEGSGSRSSGGGVLGVGGNGPGGSFESTSGPQIHLTPIHSSQPPKGGRAGDIAAIRKPATAGDLELWFCVKSQSGKKTATWAQIQLGTPVIVVG